MEIEIGNGNRNAPIAGARYCAMRMVGNTQDTAYRVEMVLCAAIEGTESNPTNLGLAEGCWMMKIVLLCQEVTLSE